MKRPLLIFLCVLLAYMLTAGGHLYSPDEEILFRTTQSLATGRGLAIQPYDPSGFGTRPPLPPRTDGLEYSQYGIGQPLLAVPFYWIGRVLTPLFDAETWQHFLGRQLPPTFTLAEYATRWACSWFNIFVGALLAVLVYAIALELTRDPRAAAWAALLYALGSLAWAHSRPFFTEPLAACFIALAVWSLLRSRPQPNESTAPHPGWLLLAGAATGYAALVRMDSAFMYPGLGLMLLATIAGLWKTRRFSKALAAILIFCLPALFAGGVILFLNWLQFGGVLETGYKDQTEGIRFLTPLLQGLYGFLFSAGKGLFFFSPALVLSFFGWRHLNALLHDRFARPASILWITGLALLILLPLLVHAKWQNWPGGWCWGPRHIFQIHAFLAIPIAAWLARAWGPFARVACLAMLILGAAVQLFGASQDFIQFYQFFYRSPGNPDAFYVTYDPHDRLYWQQFYELRFKPAPGAEPLPVGLFPPAPVHHSIYYPQHTQWHGYIWMLRNGRFDNFWYRLITAP